MNALTILLIEDETAGQLLQNRLIVLGYSVIIYNGCGAGIYAVELHAKIDMVIFNIDSPQKYYQDIDTLNHNRPLPIIIFATDDTPDTIHEIIKVGVSAYVVNGLEVSRLHGIITIAIARFKEQQLIKGELAKTKFKLEERKLIDRAKGILMKTQGYNEDEAYHTLRKLAMDRNIAIGEMAKNVIAMAELLK